MRSSIVLVCLGGVTFTLGCATAPAPASVSQLQVQADQACHGISDADRQRDVLMKGVTEAEPLIEDYRPTQKLKFRRTTGVELHHVAHKGITGPYLRRVTMCQVAQNTLLAAQNQPYDPLFGPDVTVQVHEKSYGFQILIRGESPEHAQKLVRLANAALTVPGDAGEKAEEIAAQ